MLMLDRETMLDKMKKAHEDKSYIFYGDSNFDDWTDKEVQNKYMDMINFLSDARTHTDW